MDDERRSRIRGALLGGAIGDALGAPVEFLDFDEIRERHGPAGVTGFLPAYGRAGGAITDDTQMTLFSAEGLLRAMVRDTHYGMVDVFGVVQRAYWRWLTTQGEPWPEAAATGPLVNGWLVSVRGLHSRRAPGTTCLAALRSGVSGTLASPINNSMGCGAVMRSAPFGLAGRVTPGPFELGQRCGALTHGHPNAHLPAGALASIVAQLVGGRDLDRALDDVEEELRRHPGHDDTSAALGRARTAAARPGDPSAERIERLGAGWVGHEALAIAVYCVLAASDPRQAVLLAVNHSGDTDSTGSIAGNIVGAAHGEAALDPALVVGLELLDVITQVADDVFDGFFAGAAGSEHEPITPKVEAFIGRYPGG